MNNQKKRTRLAVAVLAAGSSSRLGQMKQLVDYRGKPLLQQVIQQARLIKPFVDCDLSFYCVLGYQETKIREVFRRSQFDAPCTFVVNQNWRDGLSSSISCIVEYVRASQHNSVDGILLLLGDQWKVSSLRLQHLITEWLNQTNAIVCTEIKDTWSPPIIFPSNLFFELISLNEDKGAKSIIYKYSGRMITIAIPEAEYDLDTEEQLQEFNSFIEKLPSNTKERNQ